MENSSQQKIVTLQGIDYNSFLSDIAAVVKQQIKSDQEKLKPLKRHMNIDECSEYADMPKATIYQKCSNREFPHSKVGGRLKFDRSEIDAYIAARKRTMVEDI